MIWKVLIQVYKKKFDLFHICLLSSNPLIILSRNQVKQTSHLRKHIFTENPFVGQIFTIFTTDRPFIRRTSTTAASCSNKRILNKYQMRDVRIENASNSLLNARNNINALNLRFLGVTECGGVPCLFCLSAWHPSRILWPICYNNILSVMTIWFLWR